MIEDIESTTSVDVEVAVDQGVHQAKGKGLLSPSNHYAEEEFHFDEADCALMEDLHNVIHALKYKHNCDRITYLNITISSSRFGRSVYLLPARSCNLFCGDLQSPPLVNRSSFHIFRIWEVGIKVNECGSFGRREDVRLCVLRAQ